MDVRTHRRTNGRRLDYCTISSPCEPSAHVRNIYRSRDFPTFSKQGPGTYDFKKNNTYVGCSESSCNCVISLVIFIRCTGKFVCVDFHLFLIVERKEKEK